VWSSAAQGPGGTPTRRQTGANPRLRQQAQPLADREDGLGEPRLPRILPSGLDDLTQQRRAVHAPGVVRARLRRFAIVALERPLPLPRCRSVSVL
jgi:hypothetical protein